MKVDVKKLLIKLENEFDEHMRLWGVYHDLVLVSIKVGDTEIGSYYQKKAQREIDEAKRLATAINVIEERVS